MQIALTLLDTFYFAWPLCCGASQGWSTSYMYIYLSIHKKRDSEVYSICGVEKIYCRQIIFVENMRCVIIIISFTGCKPKSGVRGSYR